MSGTKYPILVVVPTLNRPRGLAQCLDSLASTSTGLADFMTVERSGEPGMQSALNSIPLALIDQYEVVGLINDDVRMRTQGWDALVYNEIRGSTALVYGRDGIQNEALCTQPFFSAHVAVDIGLLAPPPPFRCLLDNFWWEIFRAIGRLRYRPGLFTEHLHFTVGKAAMDKTYELGQNAFMADWQRWPDFCANELPRLVKRIKVRP